MIEVPAQFSAMMGYIEHEIASDCIDVARAKQISLRIIERLAVEYGGTSFYCPKQDSMNRSKRNESIRRLYDGTTEGANGTRALAVRFNLTEIRVHQILGEKRRIHKPTNEVLNHG